jgi:cytochrome c553
MTSDSNKRVAQPSRPTPTPSAAPKLFAASALALFAFGVLAAPPQKGETIKPDATDAAKSEVFEAKIRPVLEAKCIACHGPKQQLKGLRLDKPISTELAQKLVDAIAYKGDVQMPPAGKLPADELAALTAWGKAGAPWPASHTVAKSKGPFWAFVSPKRPHLPKVKNASWTQSPIDRFILAKLEAKGLKPAPPADRRTLIRRATFDLTGLPPTPAEIAAFLIDRKPGAFERVVDRLLASPAYGERWGRHWLDVARYADSNGLDENLVYPNAWRYRDYVINAFNADKPIDRFFQEQIAGDLIPGAGDEGIVATGYLSLGAKMLAEDDPMKQELDIIDEQVDTTSKTFLALTVGCARCHDHKFDPIPSKDYYSLAGIFKSTRTMLNFKNMAEWNERALGSPAEQSKFALIEAQMRVLADTATKKREAASEVLLKQLQPQTPTYVKAAKALLAAEANKPELHPVIATDPNTHQDAPTPADAMVHEAEDFTSGNVIVDRDGFGKGIGVLVNKGDLPDRTEYDITVPSAGPYQLDMRYATGDARPIRVYANGDIVLSNAAGQVTGGFYPQHQKWFAEGVFNLKAGVNHLKFERDSYFPHIDKFLLIARPGLQPSESLASIAKADNLFPEIVRDVADRIKNGIDVHIELPDEPDHLFPADVAAELKKLADQKAELAKSKPKLPLAMAVSDGKPTNLKVHLRGNYLTLGELAPRRFPSAISDSSLPPIPADHSGRLELAHWLTDAKNPLTARVFVNRVWRWRFGRGIVGSVDNFGTLGDLPSHPELLDYLATTFMKEDGWSLKKLHKRLMLTSTYQMSGQYNAKAANVDQDNRLLWRFPRQRLEAEAIRDTILAVSGTLDRKMGGTTMNLAPRSYVTSTANDDPVKYDALRRAVYLPVIRSAVYDVYTAFDFGDPTVMNGDRSSTTVAPQALFMLNSSVVLAATKAQATNLLKRPGLSDAQRVQKLYLTCYGRHAKTDEVALALDYLKRFEVAYAKAKDPMLSSWQSLCKAVMAANEFIYVE